MHSPGPHFTLDHWPAALLSFIPFLINFFLFVYAYFLFRHSKLTRAFYFFIISLCISQLSDILVRLSPSAEAAGYWYLLLSPALNLIPPFALHFTLIFTRAKKLARSNLFIWFLYFPTFIFRFLSNFGEAPVYAEPSQFWGWIIVPGTNVAEQLNAFWNVLLTVILISLLVRFNRQAKYTNRTLHEQSRIVLLGFLVPAFLSIITEFVFPFFLKLQPVPMLSTSLSFFSVCIILALKNHELLSFSPQSAWTGIINKMNEGLLIVNNDDEIQFANAHFCNMTGYTEKELLHQKASTLLLDQAQQQKIESKIRERRSDSSDRYELMINKKSGEHIWVAISGFPYYDRQGNVIGSIGLHTDISEQKRAEAALVQSESHMRFFMEESLLSIYILNPLTKKITWANKAFLDLLGYTQKDIGDIGIYDFVDHPKENLDVRIEEVLVTRKQNVGERKWRTKTGQQINVIVNSVCINHNNEDILYVSGQDITSLKQLENSLNQKIKDLNIFIYQVSHDIKGPLSSILGLATVADRETHDTNQKAYLDMIAQSTKRLNHTLEDLLDIIVITQGKLKFEPLHITEQLNEIKKNLTALPNYSSVKIREMIDLPLDLISDKIMFNAIMQNLVANAINYADLEKNEQLITISATKAKNEIVIEVEDNGIGIPPAMQEKIWDMFFRANNTTKGTGLGLFIAHNAVERLRGEIKVNSEPGKGSKFTLSIPTGVIY